MIAAPPAGPEHYEPRSEQVAESPSRLPRMFSSFAYSGFRWLFAASFAGSLGNWMETVVRSVVVYEITGSALALGLVNSGRAVPGLFFGVVGGVLADRMDRRVLLMIAQAIHGACGAALATLIVLGVIEPWHFALAAFIEGTCGSFQMPARQAMVPSLVPPSSLMNAVALNSSTQRISKTIAPAVAAFIAAIFSPAAALYLEAGLYAIAVACVTRIDTGRTLGSPPGGDVVERPGRWGIHERGRRRHSVIEGFKGYGYLKQNPLVGWLIVIGLVPIIFSFANNSMAPIFAKDVLHLDYAGVGLLLSAPGIGAVVATLYCAAAGDLPRKGFLSLLGVVALGLTTIGYGLSSWLWVSLAFLVLHGFAQAFYHTMNHTLVQLHTPDEYRGRVMAVYHTDRAFHPIGTIAVVALAEAWGPQAAMVASGVGCALTAVLIAVRARAVRNLN